MGGLCMCVSWSCRPALWSLFIILATIPSMINCSDGEAAADDGKVYPRGNHWAVGHLMGKKSTDSSPELQETNSFSEFNAPSEAAGISVMERYRRLMEALKLQRSYKETVADRLLRLHREEDRDKYLRETPLQAWAPLFCLLCCIFALSGFFFTFGFIFWFVSILSAQRTFRQMSNLLQLALKLQDSNST